MRPICLLCLLVLMTGCATQRPPQPLARPQYDDKPAAALIFNVPGAAHLPDDLLARDLRQPSAFVAYEDLTTTFFLVRTDDRQWLNGWPLRTAVSERIGTSYR